MENETFNNRVNFTKKNLNELPLPEKGYKQYYDKVTPGLIIRVHPTGVKTFYLYRRIDGRAEYISLGSYPAVFPEQARRHASELNVKIGAGKNPAEERRSLKAEITLGELFTQFIENHAKKHKRTWRFDVRQFNCYFSLWQNRKISSIQSREVQSLHAKIGAENGIYAANRAFALLHTLYSMAEMWGYNGKNPVHKLQKFHVESRDRFLQENELPLFFQAVREEPNEMIRDFVLMSLFTGGRKSNILSMAWSQINFEQAIWNIQGGQTKNKEPHAVPLTTFALEILKRRKVECGDRSWVFPSIINDNHLQEPKKPWARILKKAEIENMRLHDLRRSLGAWMAITGSSLLIISQCLGHKVASSNVTGVYARLSLEPVRQAMETAVKAMLVKGGMIPEEDNIIKFKKSV